jgi:hypothetical protein
MEFVELFPVPDPSALSLRLSFEFVPFELDWSLSDPFWLSPP